MNDPEKTIRRNCGVEKHPDFDPPFLGQTATCDTLKQFTKKIEKLIKDLLMHLAR